MAEGRHQLCLTGMDDSKNDSSISTSTVPKHRYKKNIKNEPSAYYDVDLETTLGKSGELSSHHPSLPPKPVTLSRSSSVTSSETDFYLTTMRWNHALERIRNETLFDNDYVVLENINVPDNFIEVDVDRLLQLQMDLGGLSDPGMTRPSKPQYPCGEEVFSECYVCFDTRNIRRRLCCDFPVCDECMENYLSAQVNQRIVKIECLNTACQCYIHRDEIIARLSGDLKEKFYKFLIDANKDPSIKTCPRCSGVYRTEKSYMSDRKLKKKGLKVICPDCKLVWCFCCQAPWHDNITCKQFRKGDKMVKNWAHEYHYGQCNAQKCPKCKVFIEKKGGCDHMTCNVCHTSFCYRCGERYLSLKIIGDHSGTFSPFGCKYNFLPERPGARRFIRGSVLSAKVLGGVFLLGLAAAAGAVILGASAIILPAYGGYRYHKHRQRKKWLKKRENMWKQRRLEILTARSAMESNNVDEKDHTTDDEGAKTDEAEAKAQQVEVWVHYASQRCNAGQSENGNTNDSDTAASQSRTDEIESSVTITQLTELETADSRYPQLNLHVETMYADKSPSCHSDSGAIERNPSCESFPEDTSSSWKSSAESWSSKSNNVISDSSEKLSESQSDTDIGEQNGKSSLGLYLNIGSLGGDQEEKETNGCLVKLFGKKISGIQFTSPDCNKTSNCPFFEKMINSGDKEVINSSFFKTSIQIVNPKTESGLEPCKKIVVDVPVVEQSADGDDLSVGDHNDQPDVVTCALESKKKKKNWAGERIESSKSQLGSNTVNHIRDVLSDKEKDPYLGIISLDSYETAL